MGRLTITKAFEFDYAHRLHAQNVDPELSLGALNKCRRIHGHRGRIDVVLGADHTDPSGMVTDFGNLAVLKRFVNTYLDHRCLLDLADPMLQRLVGDRAREDLCVGDDPTPVGWVLDLDGLEDTPDCDYLASYVIVDFLTTSENLAAWVFRIAERIVARTGARIERVEWWETPTSRAIYAAS